MNTKLQDKKEWVEEKLAANQKAYDEIQATYSTSKTKPTFSKRCAAKLTPN